MIVEAFGLPGSGKSTLLRALFQSPDVSFQRVSAQTRTARFLWLVWGCLTHPVLAYSFLREIIQQPKNLQRYLLHLWTRSFAETIHARVLQRFSPSNIFFLDEGLTQRLLSVCDQPGSARLADQVMRFSRQHVFLIVLGGDFQRFHDQKSGPVSPRAESSPEALERWERHARQFFALHAARLQHEARTIVLENETRPELDVLVRTVKQSLNSFAT